ncbi:unnamed protein product [Clavelina lepadiformis]|uniref:Polyprotein n=1 Tax=Clavelina lepadiformis TaxID=159417 RepID=A0ABP0G0H1_CLALP
MIQKRSCDKIEICLAWEQKDAERFLKARSAILQRIQSAMEIRWCGRPDSHKFSSRISPGVAKCYDCAAGRHKLYNIVGLTDQYVDDRINFLNESNGFKRNCAVVQVVNKWYAEINIAKCTATKEKADKMETLLNRVLKEFYLKRYFERGQLVSQTYHTVMND